MQTLKFSADYKKITKKMGMFTEDNVFLSVWVDLILFTYMVNHGK